MRLGVLADVHGNAPALEATLRALGDGSDEIVFLGDLAGYYPFVDEAAALLEEAGVRHGVLGNHDAVLLRCLQEGTPPDAEYTRRYGSALRRTCDRIGSVARRLLEQWSATADLSRAGRHISLVHGAPWDPMEGRVYPDFEAWHRFDAFEADIFLLGHTHYAFQRRLGGRLVLNPGSVGQPRDRSNGAAYAVVDTESLSATLCRTEYLKARVIADAAYHDPMLPYLTEVLTR